MDRPVPIPYDQVHLGNKDTHSTHKLYTLRGLMYCKKCGARSATRLNKLSRVCEPPSDAGVAALAALSQGKLPPNMNAWPSQ